MKKRPKQEEYPDTMHGIGYNDYVVALEKYCDILEKQTQESDCISDIISIWKLFCLGLGYLTFTILAMYYIFGGSISIEINMIESWQLVKSWFNY